MKKIKTGIFLFTNDLRLHDNPALMQANVLVDELLCVYVVDPWWRSSNQYSQSVVSQNAERFLRESLVDLDNSLGRLGQRLMIIQADVLPTLKALIEQVNASHVFRSENAGWYEGRTWRKLKVTYPRVSFHSVDSHTLYDRDMLPFSVNELPTSFTKFKNVISVSGVAKPISVLSFLPPYPVVYHPGEIPLDPIQMLHRKDAAETFRGGESHGVAHLKGYFSSDKPSHYKEVRNAIYGWDNSCKLSPWLANGSLSVRKVMSVLSDYEQNEEANESTYWIFFELLWREYFQWYAYKYGTKLFSFKGIKDRKLLTSFYPERFKKWVNGSTPFALVNACMNELSATGYLSNRGRQIVASCLVNELGIDWRFGAAYFEQTLIDYDVASNWGNWQYLAGVGADTRDKRHFNLEKQTYQFDPDGRYIGLWCGDNNHQPLDSLDAADWPISQSLPERS